MFWFGVRDIALATFQEKSTCRSVMVASHSRIRPPLDPAQFWICESY